MTDWKDKTTIEISTPDGKRSGPIPLKEWSENVKEGLRKMATKPKADDRPAYWRDNVLDQIGELYIKNQHPHLLDAEVTFLVTKKPMNRAGKTLAGKAQTVSGLLLYFARADFIVIVSDDAWSKMDRRHQEALVDHELCHCGREQDEDGKTLWVMVGHDIEEFTAIVDRHGLWHEGLKTFGQAVARQMEMPFEEKKENKAEELLRSLTLKRTVQQTKDKTT